MPKSEDGTHFDLLEDHTVPELLKLLVLKNCIVTTDAANCQAQNTQTIIGKGGDYVLALKENQAALHENTVLAFEHEDKSNFRGVEHETWTTLETSHGRKETREYTLLSEPDYIDHMNASAITPDYLRTVLSAAVTSN
jgi:predicted transposase YbfD/YdcC